MRGLGMDFAVGLIFFLAMGALGYTTIFKAQRFGRTKYYQVQFPQVYGLKEGSQVRCEGKTVGEVKDLQLVSEGVLAVLEVNEDVSVYTLGSKISVTPFSPLGGRIVEITRGRPGTAELAPIALVAGKADQSQQDKTHKGDAQGELLTALTELINANRDKVDTIFSNLKNASDRLSERDTNLVGKILNDKDFSDRVDGIVTHLRNASRSIESVTGRLERGEGLLGEVTVEGRPLQENLRGLIERGRDATDELAKAGKSVNEGKGLVSTMLNDEKLADDARGSVANISSITGTIAQGKGVMRFFSEEGDEIYANVREITAEGRDITRKINDEKAGVIGHLVSSKKSQENVERTLEDLAATARKLNDKEAGALGALLGDPQLAERTRQVFNEAGRVLKEFRDSIEDVREQAPVSAFLGTAFSAF